jgi:hypothetical protein
VLCSDLSCWPLGQGSLCFLEPGHLGPPTLCQPLSQQSSLASPPTNSLCVLPTVKIRTALAKGTSDSGQILVLLPHEGLQDWARSRQGILPLVPQLKPLQGGSVHQKSHLLLLPVDHERAPLSDPRQGCRAPGKQKFPELSRGRSCS